MTFLPSFCTPAEARTLDTLIKSQVLYQLSYKRIVIFKVNKLKSYLVDKLLVFFVVQLSSLILFKKYACRGSNSGHPD